MREIKFKAWDKTNKQIAEVLAIDYLANEVMLDYFGKMYFLNFEYAELLQFTGLKDKNGQEIYEGDIVKARSEGKSALGKVIQRIDGLWLLYPAWQGKEFWGLCPNNKGNTTVEVIGNIYESPEIME